MVVFPPLLLLLASLQGIAASTGEDIRRVPMVKDWIFENMSPDSKEKAFQATLNELIQGSDDCGNGAHVAHSFGNIVKNPTDDEHLELVRDYLNDASFDKTGQLRYASVPVIEDQLVDDILEVIYSRVEYVRLLNNPDENDMANVIKEMIRIPTQTVLKQQLFHKILASRAWYEKFFSPMLENNKRQKLLNFARHLLESHDNGNLSTVDMAMFNKQLVNVAFFDRPDDQEFRSVVNKLMNLFGSSMNMSLGESSLSTSTVSSHFIETTPKEMKDGLRWTKNNNFEDDHLIAVHPSKTADERFPTEQSPKNAFVGLEQANISTSTSKSLVDSSYSTSTTRSHNGPWKKTRRGRPENRTYDYNDDILDILGIRSQCEQYCDWRYLPRKRNRPADMTLCDMCSFCNRCKIGSYEDDDDDDKDDDDDGEEEPFMAKKCRRCLRGETTTSDRPTRLTFAGTPDPWDTMLYEPTHPSKNASVGSKGGNNSVSEKKESMMNTTTDWPTTSTDNKASRDSSGGLNQNTTTDPISPTTVEYTNSLPITVQNTTIKPTTTTNSKNAQPDAENSSMTGHNETQTTEESSISSSHTTTEPDSTDMYVRSENQTTEESVATTESTATLSDREQAILREAEMVRLALNGSSTVKTTDSPLSTSGSLQTTAKPTGREKAILEEAERVRAYLNATSEPTTMNSTVSTSSSSDSLRMYLNATSEPTTVNSTISPITTINTTTVKPTVKPQRGAGIHFIPPGQMARFYQKPTTTAPSKNTTTSITPNTSSTIPSVVSSTALPSESSLTEDPLVYVRDNNQDKEVTGIDKHGKGKNKE